MCIAIGVEGDRIDACKCEADLENWRCAGAGEIGNGEISDLDFAVGEWNSGTGTLFELQSATCQAQNCGAQINRGNNSVKACAGSSGGRARNTCGVPDDVSKLIHNQTALFVNFGDALVLDASVNRSDEKGRNCTKKDAEHRDVQQ